MDGPAAAERLRDLHEAVKGRSPLYDRLLAGLAGAAERGFDGGTIARLLATPGPAGPDEARLLVLAALHHAALTDPDLPHAAWYPTARPEGALPADQGAPGALALAWLVEHEDEVREFVATRRLQTNEVGRCTALLPALLEVAGLGPPLRLIELGSSAGLQLRFDRYHYRYQPGPSWGPSGGPELVARAEGAVPRSLAPPSVTLAERIAVDLDPIDPGTEDGARTLTSFVWPDERDRHRRLEGALTVARSTPVTTIRADLVTYAAEEVAPTPGTTTVLLHSQVRHLLPPAEATRLADAVERLLRRARPDAPVAHVAFEAVAGTSPGDPPPEVSLAIGRGDGPPRRRTVVSADWHGRWVRWP